MPDDAVDAFIGLGANLGDARDTLRAAESALKGLPETDWRATSAHYRTAPVDAQGPDFINAVVWLRTRLEPQALLDQLHRIEQAQGRERPYRNSPRTLDLDLLLYGNASIDTPALTVPHPRLHLRAFALVPLAELSADAAIGAHGRARDLLTRVADQAIERLPE